MLLSREDQIRGGGRRSFGRAGLRGLRLAFIPVLVNRALIPRQVRSLLSDLGRIHCPGPIKKSI